jgi:hypothetical protein
MIKKLPGGQQLVVKCECSAVFTVYLSSLRTNKRRACERCQDLEKKLAQHIAAAKRAILLSGGRLPVEMPQESSKWEYVPAHPLEPLDE